MIHELLRLCEKFATTHATFQLAVHVLDRYTSFDNAFHYYRPEQNAVLGAIMLIAGKMYEIYAPTCSQLYQFFSDQGKKVDVQLITVSTVIYDY